MKTIWILGKTHDGSGWEICGAFPDRDSAINVCRPGEFIGPMPFGERLPDERMVWPDAEYPKGAR